MPEFEPIRRLGEGNFGEVWLTFDKALGVNRAVKYIRPSKVTNPTEFYSEPQALVALQHENIVRVEDAGRTQGGHLYVSMEYLPKGSVETVYSGRPLPLNVAKKILCETSRGLQYAHSQGYVHRDLKPANILLTEELVAKLSDFGLAVRVPQGSVASPHGYLTHLAPEVFTENRTDPLTDIYALGVTAYRLFNGDSYLPSPEAIEELQDLIVEGKYPDRSKYQPYIPRQLRQIVNKSINPDPEYRYKSASSFRRALERLSIHCDWRIRHGRERTTFFTSIGGVKWRVTEIERQDRRYSVSVVRESESGQVRNKHIDSVKAVTKAKARSHLHKILSRITLEGR